jgi:hypothetical protein
VGIEEMVATGTEPAAHVVSDGSRHHVVFEYIKSAAFRVIHADGIIGGVTPAGNLHLAFYSERAALPRRQAFAINPNGSLGELLPDETVSRNSVIREMDIDVVISRKAAEAMMHWLGERLEDLGKLEQRAAGDVS